MILEYEVANSVEAMTIHNKKHNFIAPRKGP
jgi:hypothetical protein